MPLIGLAAAALAHDVVGSRALRPFVAGGELLGAWTTWGVVAREGEAWVRTCEEAHPGLRDAWLRPDGTWVLAGADGLRSSVDGGCSVGSEVHPDPVGAVTSAGGRLWLIADRGAADGLLVSDDELRTVSEVPLPSPIDARSLAEAGDGALWIGGLAGGAPAVVRQAGEGWEPVPAPDPAAVAVVVHGPAPSGGGVVASTVAPSGRGALWTMVDGAEWALLADLPLAATGWGCVGERCLVAVNQATLLGFDRAAPPPVEPAPIDGPTGCLWAIGGELWGCAPAGAPHQLQRTADGLSWTDELPVDAIVERPCPDGSPAAAACLPPDPEPPATEPPPVVVADRGCATAPIAGGLGLVVALLLRRGARTLPPGL